MESGGAESSEDQGKDRAEVSSAAEETRKDGGEKRPADSTRSRSKSSQGQKPDPVG